MGRAVGPVVPVTGARGEAADGVDGGGLLRLLFAQWRQDAGQSAGQHALAGAGYPTLRRFLSHPNMVCQVDTSPTLTTLVDMAIVWATLWLSCSTSISARPLGSHI